MDTVRETVAGTVLDTVLGAAMETVTNTVLETVLDTAMEAVMGNVLGNHGQTSAGCSLDMGQVTVNTPCPMSHVMSPLLHTLGPASPHLEITRQLWRRNHAEEDSCGGVVRKHVMLDAWSVLYPSSHLRASTLLRMPRSNRCHDVTRVTLLHVCLYAIHICIDVYLFAYPT